MARSYNCLLFCFIVLFIIPPTTSISNTSSKPKALALLVSKDSSTLQYLTQIKQRTPLVPVKLTLDLGGQFLWVDCDQGYVSTSYKPARCGSAQCKLARSKSCIDEYSCSPGPGCNNHTCSRFPANSISRESTNRGELATDVVSVQSIDIDGKANPPGPFVSVPNLIFSCGPTFLLDGLATGVKGMAGLGRTQVSLHSQFSAAFNFDRKFSICLSSSTTSNGAVFFGDVPFPNIDVSKSLIYTPLILNPVHNEGLAFKGDPSTDYFIEIKSILIGGNVVPLNTSLLSINKQGNGGTKVSTADPYTVLETSIYKAFIETFSKALLFNIPRVKPIAPFGACFNSSFIGGTTAPEIHLVLPGNNRVWKIYGANSMVPVGKDAMCLAFVDGGVNPRTSVVIGGYQLEDNLLEFNLAKSRLGFSSSLLSWQTTCSKLTSNF